MARVWFVRRRGVQWVAPGGKPAFERPLASLVFPLDLGTHRLLAGERPRPAPELAPEEPEALERVMVEVEPDDIAGEEFSGFVAGVYDSPYSPRATAHRLASAGRSGAGGAA